MNRFALILSILFISTNIIPCIFKSTHSTNFSISEENFLTHTFISVPREPRNIVEMALLKLTVSNWITSSNNSRVILIVNESLFDANRTLYNEIEKDFGPGKLIYQATLKVERNGVPLVTSFFDGTILSTPFNIITLLNGDILVPPGWMDKVHKIFEVFGESAFITGYRLNFDIPNYSQLLNRSFKEFDIVQYVNMCHQENYTYRGMDFFTFLNHPDINFFESIPPFLITQYEWDNWLIGKMNSLYQTISLGPDCRAYHINHVSNKTRFNQYSAYNKRLRFMYYHPTGDNRHTKWVLQDGTHLHNSNTGAEILIP